MHRERTEIPSDMALSTTDTSLLATAGPYTSQLEEMSYTWSWLFSWPPIRMLGSVVYKVYLLLFAIPLFYLFLHGPSLGGFGFWEGKSFPDICSMITKVDSRVWMSSVENVQVFYQDSCVFYLTHPLLR